MSETKRKEALDYHSSFPKGKIETKITKPSETEEQLSHLEQKNKKRNI